ncbi:MAG TPA: universal stress protein [Nitrosomonas nitrosa]|nr:universal stress protein [Nitrosomonas nitrosa]
MKQILVATDFSQYEKRAFDRAVLLGEEHRAQLDVLHVITSASVDALCNFLPDSRQVVEEKLTNSIFAQLHYFIDRVESERPIRILPRVKIDEVEDGIIKSAESCDSDLIVLGSHGEHFAHEMFVGTIAENVLGREKRPILIVKRNADLAIWQDRRAC